MGKRVVVIGTGAGGLTAAATLAKRGFEVVALEQAKQLGGFLNPFARRHYHFDPGVHYVGQCAPGEPLHALLRELDIDAEALFSPLDPDGFDLIRFPDFEVRICAGLDAYRDRLAELFPRDLTGIDRFFAVLRSADGVMNALSGLATGTSRWRDAAALAGLPGFARWGNATFGDLLAWATPNPQLRAVLAAQAGDYGLPPSLAPAALGMGVILHFARGAWFPRGGSGALRDALVERARRDGAVFRRRCRVEGLRVRGGRVTGVRVAGGEELDADLVISAIDPTRTFALLPEDAPLPAALRRRVERTQPSLGSLCVFLGMERDLRRHGLGAFNVWDYPTWDLEGLYAGLLEDRLPADWMFFLSPNSLKDDSGQMAPAGCSTLEVVTLLPFEPFAGWEEGRAFRRGAEYERTKSHFSASLLEAVEKRWPGLVGDVVVEDVATPVTNTFYTNAVRGAAYGPAATPEQMGLRGFRPWTPIGGLYLAGAGVFGPGVVPSLSSGVAAARIAQLTERVRGVFGSRAARTAQPG